MIDLIVVVQAVVAGLILYRSSHETQAWDRAGFALLACAAGLMTIRRVTASLDRYASVDRVVLPHIITWAMLAAATCFALELLGRTISNKQDQKKSPTRVASAKFIWPFALMLLMSASEFVPAAQSWSGERIRDLTPDEATREVLAGDNPAAACEAVRRHSSRGIDVLRIKAGSGEPGSADALQKLRSLASRVNSALQAYEDTKKPAETK